MSSELVTVLLLDLTVTHCWSEAEVSAWFSKMSKRLLLLRQESEKALLLSITLDFASKEMV